MVEYFPAPQAEQELAPAPLYLPAPQGVQVEELDAPVAEEYFPAPQAVQVEELVALVVVEYLPAPQAVQELALAPLYLPALHEQHSFLQLVSK